MTFMTRAELQRNYDRHMDAAPRSVARCELCREALGPASTWKLGDDGSLAHLDCLRDAGRVL